jgi:phosphotriesterase-related protein
MTQPAGSPQDAHIQTVTGAISVDAIGRTLIHEHVICDLTTYWRPQDAPEDSHRSLSLETLALVRADPFAIRHDLTLDQMDVAVEELAIHRDLGGGGVVEVTSHGIGRDVRALHAISRLSGVPIVAGCGYYIGSSRARGFEKRTVAELSDELVRELTDGVDGSAVKAGVIGEIGVGQWPMSDHERTMLRAAAHAQRETDAGMIVHPAPGTESALELVRILDRAGARMDKVVVSHLDERFRDNLALFRRVARTGVRFGFDTFGRETYYTSRQRQHPSDAQRIETVLRLWDIGLGDRIGLAQDICIRHELAAWGGPGYGHILGRIVPRMRHQGLGDAEIDAMLIDMPAAILAMPGPG